MEEKIRNRRIQHLEKYISKSWEEYFMDFIMKYDKLQYINWRKLSFNPNITIDIIKRYRDKQWDWCVLSRHKNITMEIVNANRELPWSWFYLSLNPNLTMKMICDNLEKDWNWFYISVNPNITMDDINQHINKDWAEWHWYNGISDNPNLTIDFIKEHLDKNWDWHKISHNPNITMDIVEKYWDAPWADWHSEYLSSNKNITIEFIRKHSNLQFNWCSISENESITMKMIEDNPDLKWEPTSICRNPNLTFQMVSKYLIPINHFLDWNAILSSKNIDLITIVKNCRSVYGLSKNPNLLFDYIKDRLMFDWDWVCISKNSFAKEKELFYQREYRKYMAVFRLQQYFNRMYDNPRYKFFRDRFNRNWEEIMCQ